MPSSVSHPNRDRTPPTPQISDSFFDDDDDDDEEEQEQEEEEDVEEEEDGDDAEEEDEEEELEENESDLPYKADDGDDRQDARVDVKSQRPGGSFGSGSSSRGDKKDVGSISKKSSSTQCKNPNPDGNDVLSNSQILNPKTSNSSGADGKETVATMRKNDFVGRNDVPYSYCEMKQMDLQSGDDRKRILSRSTSSEIETRSLPPGAEIKDQNKRPAIVCDFYAKGWCIKGSSCRFLHVKDLQKNNLPQGEGGVAADCKREVQLEGLKETTQRARMPDEPLASSFGNKSLLSSHFSSQRIQPLEHIESNTSRHLPEMPKFPTLHRDGSFPLTFPLSFGDRLGPEYAVSSSHRFMTPSSHSRSVGELASVQSQHSYSYLPLSPLNHPPNSSSSNSLLATGMLSSNRVSAWTGSLLPFSYSSLNASHLGSRPSSLLQSSSHVSGLGPDDLNSTVSKISSNDWEPSAPFRPSFLLRSLITCPGSQYDPLRDSVELPKVGEISLKASLHSQGSSIVNTTHQKNNGHVVSETRVLAGNDETMSVSSHNTNHGKDMQATEVEDVRTIDWKHRNASKRENSLGSSAVKDTTLATGDGRHRRLGPRDGVDAKVDGLRQKNKMDAGHIIEGGADKESKALRQFRAALIDSVKESLKPKWREGYLSKDAHNKIVKKAVEKVLSTMQPEQVPTSTELVVQYLAASRPKIDKLVEGYTEKYGKL